VSDPVIVDPTHVDDGVAPSPGHLGDDAGPPPSPNHWWLLLAVALPVYALIADTAGTLVALADVGDELHASSGALSWVLAAFALGFTGPYLWFARTCDGGRPKVLAVGGTVLFALGSVIAVPAQDIWWLVGARAIQGIGAAAFVAAATVLVRHVFHDDHEAQAMWLLGGAAAVAAVVGPVAAGALTEEIGWRMIYLTDLPVLVVGAWLIAVVGPADRPPGGDDVAPGEVAHRRRAAALLTGGLVALEVGLLHGRADVVAVVVSVVAVVAAALLLRAFWRGEAAAPVPLADTSAWDDRPTVGFLLGVGLAGAALSGSLLVTALVARNVIGEGPLALGLALAVFGVATVVSATTAEPLVARFSIRIPLVAGALVAAAGSALLSTLGPESTVIDLSWGLAVAGVGHGLVLGAGSLAVGLGAVAAGTGRHLVVVRAIGVALGIGVATSVMKFVENMRLDQFLLDRGASLTPADHREVDGLLSSAPHSLAALKRMVPDAVGEVNRVARDATASGARAALLVCAALTLCGAVAALTAGRRHPTSEG
jgi:MFS family permease